MVVVPIRETDRQTEGEGEREREKERERESRSAAPHTIESCRTLKYLPVQLVDKLSWENPLK